MFKVVSCFPISIGIFCVGNALSIASAIAQVAGEPTEEGSLQNRVELKKNLRKSRKRACGLARALSVILLESVIKLQRASGHINEGVEWVWGGAVVWWCGVCV